MRLIGVEMDEVRAVAEPLIEDAGRKLSQHSCERLFDLTILPACTTAVQGFAC